MDLLFLLFQAGPAMRLIFNLCYIPQRSDFKELTHEQYTAMNNGMSEEERSSLTRRRVYALLPDDPKANNKLVTEYGDNLMVLGEDEIAVFESAATMIEDYCQRRGKSFETMNEKLIYMAQMLPDVFSKGTPYEIHAKLKKCSS